MEMKLFEFQKYYNHHPTQAGLDEWLPETVADGADSPVNLASYRWRPHCRGLYQTPIAA